MRIAEAIHTYSNQQLKAVGLFKYVWTVFYRQAFR